MDLQSYHSSPLAGDSIFRRPFCKSGKIIVFLLGWLDIKNSHGSYNCWSRSRCIGRVSSLSVDEILLMMSECTARLTRYHPAYCKGSSGYGAMEVSSGKDSAFTPWRATMGFPLALSSAGQWSYRSGANMRSSQCLSMSTATKYMGPRK